MKSFNELRIVFMGTPAFAVASLEALIDAGCNVVAVITAPDRAAGRGLLPKQSEVKVAAIAANIPVLQPEKLKDLAFLAQLKSYDADLQVVVAFRMLPEVVWNMPPMGTINVHGSLLPQYRGAAPINWAVINGEKKTGVTTFLLQHAIDTGDILLQEEMPIGEQENAGDIHDKMMTLGAKVLVETVKQMANVTLQPQPQPVADTIHHAPKIFTETCRINWEAPLKNVLDLIRGLSPYPGAFTMLDDKVFKIFEAHAELFNTIDNPVAGNMFTDGKTFLKFACANGYVVPSIIQLAGKKKMSVTDFLKGYRFVSAS